MRKVLAIMCILAVGTAAAMEIPEADSPDAKLFAARCSICHALPHPKRLDWPHWRHILKLMHRRAKERGVNIPPEEWRRIAAYLKRHAR